MGVSGAQQEKGPSHYGQGQFAERRGQSFRSAYRTLKSKPSSRPQHQRSVDLLLCAKCLLVEVKTLVEAGEANEKDPSHSATVAHSTERPGPFDPLDF